jgi:hypothetical protein
VAAAAVAGLGLAGVLVVTGSTAHAVDGPRSWGFGFDRNVQIGPLGGDAEDEARITAAPEVAGLSEALVAQARVDGSTFELQAITPIRGEALPVITSGRAPRAADEIAAGGPLLRAVHLHVGDEVTFDGGHTMRIVGTTAMPNLDNGDFGYIIWAGPGALDRLRLEPVDRVLLIEAADGVSHERLDEVIADEEGGSLPFRPAQVENLRQIGSLPLVLGSFLALLALGSLAHALLSAIRSRGRELAILRSLGLVRGQVRGTVRWQAVVAVGTGLLVGVPVGLVVGSMVWRRIASTIGTPADVVVSVGGLAAIVAALLIAALAVAWWPAHRAAAARPAEVLRTE